MDQLRKSFPSSVTADTLKKLGIGPNNESYILNVLRFVDVLDKDGGKTDSAKDVFSQHKNEEFEAGFADMVQEAYSELFDLYGDSAWSLSRDDLIHFFRSSDESSEIVGKRQAGTFQVLAEKAGKRSGAAATTSPKPRSEARNTKATSEPKKASKKATDRKVQADPTDTKRSRDVGLTVRVEVNLPAEGDQATYDRIFKSIRQYLIDG